MDASIYVIISFPPGIKYIRYKVSDLRKYENLHTDHLFMWTETLNEWDTVLEF